MFFFNLLSMLQWTTHCTYQEIKRFESHSVTTKRKHVNETKLQRLKTERPLCGCCLHLTHSCHIKCSFLNRVRIKVLAIQQNTTAMSQTGLNTWQRPNTFNTVKTITRFIFKRTIHILTLQSAPVKLSVIWSVFLYAHKTRGVCHLRTIWHFISVIF